MKNRAQGVSALISNFDQAEAALQTALTATGSATQENEKYLESISGRLDILTANFQNLWANAIDDSVLVFFIDLGSTILDLVDNFGMLNTLISSFVGISTLKGAGLFSLGKNNKANGNFFFSDMAVDSARKFKKQIEELNLKELFLGKDNSWKDIRRLFTGEYQLKTPEIISADTATDIINNLKLSKLSLDDFIKANSNAYSDDALNALRQYGKLTEINAMSTEGLVRQSKASAKEIGNSVKQIGLLGKAFNVLKGALSIAGNIAVAMLITEGISFAWNEIMNLINAEEIAIEKGQEAQKAAQEAYDSFAEQKTSLTDIAVNITGGEVDSTNITSTIDEIATEWAELQKGVNPLTGENISLSSEQYQRYLDVSNQLASLFPTLITGTTAQGDALVDLGSNATEAADKLTELVDAQRAMTYYDQLEQMPDTVEGLSTELESVQRDLEKQKELFEETKRQIDDINNLRGQISFDESLGILSIPKELAPLIDSELTKNLYGNISSYLGLSADGQNIELDINTERMGENYASKVQDAVDNAIETSLDNIGIKSSEYNAAVANLEAQTQGILSEGISAVSNLIETNPDFVILSDELQNAILSSLGNLDLISIMEDADFDPETFAYDIQRTYLDPFIDASDQAKEALTEALTMDREDLTLQEYNRTMLDAFAQAFPNAEDLKNALDLFGFNDIIDEYSNMAEVLRSKFKGYEDEIFQMDMGELQLAYDLAVSDDSIKSFEDLVREMENAKKQSKELESISFESFEDLIADDSETSFSKRLDEFNSMRDAFEEARASLLSGDFSLSDYADLLTQFPDLGNYTNSIEDLGTAMGKLQGIQLGDRLKEIGQYINEFSKIGADTTALEAIRDTLLMDLSNVPIQEMRSQLVDLFTEEEYRINFRIGEDSVASINSFLDGLTDQEITIFYKYVQAEGIDLDTKSSTDLPKILEDAQSYAKEHPITFDDLISDGSIEEVISEAESQLSSYQSALEDFRSGDKTADELRLEIPALIGIDDENIESELESLASDVIDKANAVIDQLSNSLTSPEDVARLQSLKELLKDAFDFSDTEISSFSELIKDDAFSDTVDEYTDSINSLTEAQEKLNQGTFSDTDLASLIEQFPDLASEAGDLDNAIQELINTADEDIWSYFNEQVSNLEAQGLYEEAEALRNYAEIAVNAAHEIETATATVGGTTFETPGLQEIEDALASENEGSMYESLLSYYEQAKDLYDQGLVGTDEFKAIAKMFSLNGMTDRVNFAENMGKIERYMTEDSTGVQNFLEDLEEKGYATFETLSDGTQKWTYDIQDLEEVASNMGMSYECLMARFGK